jgi:hypothetical protein
MKQKMFNQIIFNNYPNSSLEHFIFGLALLLNGNYEEGFKHYEWRLLLNEYKREIAGKLRWNGENLYNKTLFVYGEHRYRRYNYVLKIFTAN